MGKIVPLRELIEKLPSLDAEMTIYVAQPWEISSAACVGIETEDGHPPQLALENELSYFLEVFITKEFAEAYAKSQSIELSGTTVAERLIRYAMLNA